MYFEDNAGVIVNPKGEGKGSAADQKPLSVETADGNSNGIASGGAMKANNGSAPVKPTYQNSPFNSNGRALPGGFPLLVIRIQDLLLMGYDLLSHG